MIGRLPRNGIRCSSRVTLSEMRPPRTTMPPSSTITLVSTVRLLVVMSTVETDVGGHTRAFDVDLQHQRTSLRRDLRRYLEDCTHLLPSAPS